MIFNPNPLYAFDDILIQPQYSDIHSRKLIDLSNNLKNIKFDIPIISSPMDTVTEGEMAVAMYKEGGLGIVHRYNSIEEQCNIILKIKEKNPSIDMQKIAAAVGVSDDFQKRVSALHDIGVTTICIDVANGHNDNVKKAIEFCKLNFSDLTIIAGNVATYEGAKFLAEAGVDGIRVGIGSGCFVAGTKVLTENGQKNIEDIKRGEKVFTHTGKLQTVVETMQFFVKDEIYNINGIQCTKNHEFFTLKKEEVKSHQDPRSFGKWVSAEDLELGVHFLQKFYQNYDSMDSVEIKVYDKIKYSGMVYDLTVENDHSYIANNIVVHNSICSTRVQTGHGVPQVTAITECAKVKENFPNVKIIADGGIKNSGDIVKALACGSDFVILGSLLAGTEESPGDIVTINGKKGKIYRGMASKEAQLDWKGSYSSYEGVSTTIPYKGKLTEILDDLKRGISSGLSYSGCRSIKEFQENAIIVIQTPAAQFESSTHINAVGLK